jgi:hypothetical protein
MLTLHDRALAVLVQAWRLLPAIKHQADLAAVEVCDMGAKHGSYAMDDGTLGLSTRLFMGDNPAQLMMLDVNGDAPPNTVPFCSRALHTALHELAHAIGAGTGLDDTDAWRGLSGWVQADDDPEGTRRYWESRPGWTPSGPSDWRYRVGTWFVRDYSTKSPYEDFADCVAHMALGWHDFLAAPGPWQANGRAKLRYLTRQVWEETSSQALAAAAQRWRRRLVGVR